jgi:hypothetical protein
MYKQVMSNTPLASFLATFFGTYLPILAFGSMLSFFGFFSFMGLEFVSLTVIVSLTACLFGALRAKRACIEGISPAAAGASVVGLLSVIVLLPSAVPAIQSGKDDALFMYALAVGFVLLHGAIVYAVLRVGTR